jgi:hypothetical protein
MIITIINVGKPEQVSGKKYSTVEVAFKDSSGKVGGKKLMSFTYPEVFKAIQNFTSGDTVDVTTVKEGDYWQWTNVAKVSDGSIGAPTATESPTKGFAKASENRYETPEERATRQRLIVRQSSLTTAISILEASKAKPDVVSIKALAEDLCNWVYEKGEVGLENMADDIPE